jgi:hypothetical protein
VRLAQAGPLDPSMFDPRSFSATPPPAAQGIRKAPPPGATAAPTPQPLPPGTLPSQEPIVPRGTAEFPDPGAVPPPPMQRGMTPREQALREFARDPRNSDLGRQRAEKDYGELEQQRLKADERDWNIWSAERTRIQGEHKAREEWIRNTPERIRKEQKERLEIEAGQRPKPEDVEGKLVYDPVSRSWVKPQIAGQTPDAVPNPKLSEDQRKTLTFYNWANTGHQGLVGKDQLFAHGMQQEALGKVPFVGNALMSDEYRRAKSAANNFVLAFMRSTSGAAYGEKEAADHARAMLPKYGDDPKTARDKAEQRQNFVDGLYGSLGPAREVADYYAKKKINALEQRQGGIDEEMRGVEPRGFGDVRVNKKTGAKRVWNGHQGLEE